MTGHAYHDELPGYDERQIWFDGCEECEARGRWAVDNLGTLDRERSLRAWQRAADWNLDRGDVGPISDAERPLLHLFWRMQVWLERECSLPIGTLPVKPTDRKTLLGG